MNASVSDLSFVCKSLLVGMQVVASWRLNIVPNDSPPRIPHVINTSNRTGSHSSYDEPDYCSRNASFIWNDDED